MDTGFIGFVIIMGWTLLIHGGIMYLVVKKKDYSLISGFGNRPEEEQQQLIENGYMDALGKVLQITFYIFALTILLIFIPVPYGFEIGLGVFVIVLLAGMFWVQTFELPRKKKKMMWVTGIVSVVTLAFIFGLTILGFIDNDVTIEDRTLTISGTYGEEWQADDIVSVEVMDTLPEVIVKSNGFAMGSEMKGRFRLESPYEGALLFVNADHPVFLYVKTKDDDIFISREDKSRTLELYQSIQSIMK